MLFKSLNIKELRDKYPYPQCMITPVIVLLLVIVAAFPRGDELSALVLNTKLKIFQVTITP